MTGRQMSEKPFERITTPAQRAVLDAIGYGDELPEMATAARDDLLGKGLIEIDGDSYRMPKAVHGTWFAQMVALPMDGEDHE